MQMPYNIFYTTIASSIKSPTATDNAIKDIVFNEKFLSFMQMKVAIIEIGRDVALIRVLSHSFKHNQKK